MNTDLKGTMTIQIISLDGKQVSIRQQERTKEFNSFSLDISSLSEGVYFVCLNMGSEIHTIKLVR
ncbi:MAG: hypothetical protein ACI94Y_001872 [Maribacter sp.]